MLILTQGTDAVKWNCHYSLTSFILYQKLDDWNTRSLVFEPDGASLWLRGLRVHLRCRRPWFDHWVRKIPWRREWQPTPVFLPGEFCGQRSLVGYSPWGPKESGTTEQPTHNTLWTWFNWDFLSWSEWSKHIRRCKYLEEKKMKSSHLKLVLFLSLPSILQEPSHLLLLC